MSESTRSESDSLGVVELPASALYGAQTQRAANNFQISNRRLPAPFITALAHIKQAAALANIDLQQLPRPIGTAIADAAAAIAAGQYREAFILDVFQTGSGTSTNMNMNEVIARLASQACATSVHANDHVNRCQSSNDVIPSAVRVSVVMQLHARLLPAIEALITIIDNKACEYPDLVKTGRTHLMDAMPLKVADELGGWRAQLEYARGGLLAARDALLELPLGGTAVGTGINADPDFGPAAVGALAAALDLPFIPSSNRFRDISAQDATLDTSARLRGLAVVLQKIANDVRWMNSGPNAGLAEIQLPALQPGSSIMPGKINPVIAEAVVMVAAEVIGNDAAVSVAAQAGSFQLNVMQPLVADKLLGSIELLATACHHLGEKCIFGMHYRQEFLVDSLSRNPMLATALAPRIGYEAAARVAKHAASSGRTLIEVAEEETALSRAELETLLDPLRIAGGGVL